MRMRAMILRNPVSQEFGGSNFAEAQSFIALRMKIPSPASTFRKVDHQSDRKAFRFKSLVCFAWVECRVLFIHCWFLGWSILELPPTLFCFLLSGDLCYQDRVYHSVVISSSFPVRGSIILPHFGHLMK